MDLSWTQDAACRSADPDLFFPRDFQRNFDPRPAKVYCLGCPVVNLCRQWAITFHEVGIWGGMTDDERVEESGIPCLLCRRGMLTKAGPFLICTGCGEHVPAA